MDKIIPNGIIHDVAMLGAGIRQRRRQLGLTQADAAMACGVGTRFLAELERGKPTAQLGKTLQILTGLGLELTLHTRERT
ncbi:y4mF family transcriptional regulator [Natronospira proteinivora]|uniref:Y4mF family transcriptional regulator n=1 Tax=Natronospira proteinivora TaxID=1807133 RepID=A0ABT1GA09_9GAMM|nr:helix-turn-helix domain-containing protein [Natronospira proteinivora]MCP1727887.1 y4mF family transcriptional regulator [Natronospira proteinivora]